MIKNFINDKEIWETIESSRNKDKNEIKDILKKAEECNSLSLYETAVLLQTNDNVLIEEIFTLAKKVKEKIYGNRIVVFVPLYVTNECSNICLYCAFRADNTDLKRKTLNYKEIIEEVEIIQKQGHKRVLAVYGETLNFGVDKIVESVEAIYATKTEPAGEIRRVNINSAPMSVEDFKVLSKAPIGTYQCFQETYHKETYEKVHVYGQKSDYLWRLNALHRAQEAGLDDVAVGVLYGLYDPYFETLAMLRHSFELENIFGVGPHTISFPRLEPALGADLSTHPPYMVDDNLFKKIIAVLRLAVPYTGMILSTRESAELRHELINLGVSQISAGSKTSPGSYHESDINIPDTQQFKIGDERLLDEVVYDLIGMELIPSFCTACYRLGRHGKNFMDMAKNQHIKSFCQPNAILTFAEYLEDYACDKTKAAGYELIKKLMANLSNPNQQNKVSCDLHCIKNGTRDIIY